MDNDLNFNLDKTTKKDDIKNLQKRARSKYLTNSIVFSILDYFKSNGLDTVINKSYWNTYYCCDEINEFSNGSVTGKYCKNRWCLTCARIKTAREIIRYKPILEFWGDDKKFVTLTGGSTVDDLQLPNRLDFMNKSFAKIIKRINTRRRRANSQFVKVKCIRKTEITYTKKLYHLHYHLITSTLQDAKDIVTEWLSEVNSDRNYVSMNAQDIRKVDDNNLIELLKYATKMIDTSNKKAYPPYALDTIFSTLYRKKTIQPYGFKAPPEPKDDDDDSDEILELVDTYLFSEWDWYSLTTGKALSNYEPSDSIKQIVNNTNNNL